MKKSLLIISAACIVCCTSKPKENNSHNILESRNIAEIENFLKTAHPDDPKRSVLKSKLIALKNSEWTKGKKDAQPMVARPIISEIPHRSDASETEEFKRLIASTPSEHKDKTVKLLNAMFNEDISSKEVILLFKNNSDCNIVLRIQGDRFYNLAVPAKGENSIVINKDDYTLTSHVCDVLYSSRKEIKKSIFLTINNPVPVQTENKTMLGSK